MKTTEEGQGLSTSVSPVCAGRHQNIGNRCRHRKSPTVCETVLNITDCDRHRSRKAHFRSLPPPPSPPQSTPGECSPFPALPSPTHSIPYLNVGANNGMDNDDGDPVDSLTYYQHNAKLRTDAASEAGNAAGRGKREEGGCSWRAERGHSVTDVGRDGGRWMVMKQELTDLSAAINHQIHRRPAQSPTQPSGKGFSKDNVHAPTAACHRTGSSSEVDHHRYHRQHAHEGTATTSSCDDAHHHHTTKQEASSSTDQHLHHHLYHHQQQPHHSRDHHHLHHHHSRHHHHPPPAHRSPGSDVTALWEGVRRVERMVKEVCHTLAAGGGRWGLRGRKGDQEEEKKEEEVKEVCHNLRTLSGGGGVGGGQEEEKEEGVVREVCHNLRTLSGGGGVGGGQEEEKEEGVVKEVCHNLKSLAGGVGLGGGQEEKKEEGVVKEVCHNLRTLVGGVGGGQEEQKKEDGGVKEVCHTLRTLFEGGGRDGDQEEVEEKGEMAQVVCGQRGDSAEQGPGSTSRSAAAEGDHYHDRISPDHREEKEGSAAASDSIEPQHPPCGTKTALSSSDLLFDSPTDNLPPPPPPSPSPSPPPPPPPQTTADRRLRTTEVATSVTVTRSRQFMDLQSADKHPPQDASDQSPESGEEETDDVEVEEHKPVVEQSALASSQGEGNMAQGPQGEEDGTPRQRAAWNIRLNNTQSMPALLGGSAREIQRHTEDPPCSTLELWPEREAGLPLSQDPVAGEEEEKEEEERGGGGRGVGVEEEQEEGETWRTPSQVLQQAEMLRSLWDSHRTRVRDMLTDYNKESNRASRLDQCLQRGRQMMTTLRHQRRQIQQQMEQKEEEMAQALRHHKNEAAFLRRKVLGFLEEKKTAMAAEEKCDGRLKAMLESLLSLYLDRERFLSLDLAKQNKINELKLLVVRQQLAMEELKEHKAELNQALNTLMQFLPEPRKSPQPNQPRRSPSPTAPRVGVRPWSCPGAGRGCGAGGGGGGGSTRGMGLNDVLHCERSLYLPGHSTSPELAAVTVYGIGGERNALSCPPEEVFDASRPFCHADGDHYSPQHAAQCPPGSMQDSDAETLLQELTLHGPGSANFTLSDLHP